MKALCAIVVIAGLIGVGGAPAWGDDLLPPPWRTAPPGQGATTHQVWEFSLGANPTWANIDNNLFGDPLATVVGGLPETYWLDLDRGHQGVWRIEHYMALDIPNNPVYNDLKEIWLQITYAPVGVIRPPEIASLPDYTALDLIRDIPIPLDVAYRHATYRLTIEPNPPHEILYLLPRICYLYIDEIVVDTRCVPEPASLAFLGLGGLVLLARRRRVN